jgi:IS605 OrfB family transposase
MATCDVPQASQYEPDGFLGIDLGIVNIATTSDGEIMAGRTVNRYRRRQLRLRRKLQAKGTRSAKRLLKKRARKESRFARDINHCIAKIVTEAERTSRGIALEDLTGIRDRARLRKPQRVTLSSWAFAQLGSFIKYKALRAGVPTVYVDPAWTSRTQTGTLPATSPPAARLPGMRGVSHAPLPLPATGKGWTRQPVSPPVMP